jgi:hypothetical protein
LLATVSICNPAGNAPGSGAERLLESIWSSTSDDSEEIDPVTVPEIEVEDRSLKDIK